MIWVHAASSSCSTTGCGAAFITIDCLNSSLLTGTKILRKDSDDCLPSSHPLAEESAATCRSGWLINMGDPQRDCIVIRSEGRVVTLPVADIIYFAASEKYLIVTTPTQTYRIEDSLDRLAEQLGNRFRRTHRKYLVRSSAIRARVRVGVGGPLMSLVCRT